MIDLFLVIYLILIPLVVYNRINVLAYKEKHYKKAKLISDMTYLKHEKERIVLEQKELDKNIYKISERLTRVEESAKQAHKRIDKIEGER